MSIYQGLTFIQHGYKISEINQGKLENYYYGRDRNKYHRENNPIERIFMVVEVDRDYIRYHHCYIKCSKSISLQYDGWFIFFSIMVNCGHDMAG